MLNMLSLNHKLLYPKKGDFFVDEHYTLEVGGKNKGFEQTSVPLEGIKDIVDSFVVKDDVEVGFKNSIPLWFFGFLY